MKWYTLEERPIKECGEQGLFWVILIKDRPKDYRCATGFSVYIGNDLRREVDGIRLDMYDCCGNLDGQTYVPFEDIKYWMPLAELEATLPKDKE